MTDRIVVERLILPSLPFELNPLRIAKELLAQQSATQARFLTSITARYTPNVSASTPGQTILCASQEPAGNYNKAASAACKVIRPVWKGFALVIPKDLLSFESWSRAGTPHLWLSAIGAEGTVDISCTIRAVSQPLISLPLTPDEKLVRISTQAYVGPILAGFSLVGGLPYSPQPSWTGIGQVINVDLMDATGTTTSTRYVRTPENRNYVAVLYGFGSTMDYVLNSSNKPYRWKSWNDVLWDYDFQSNDSWYNTGVAYVGTWRPIVGNTSWWLEANARKTEVVLGGTRVTWYYPLAHLILYYYFPGVDIFADDFTPTLTAHPGDAIPCPPGNAEANKLQMLPLATHRLVSLWNASWNPVLDSIVAGTQQRYVLAKYKQGITEWPDNCNQIMYSKGNPEDEPKGMDEGPVTGDDASQPALS